MATLADNPAGVSYGALDTLQHLLPLLPNTGLAGWR